MASKKNNAIDYLSLKKDLLSDLDQFLVDEGANGVLKTEKKQAALAELDKLIREDLSYSQILHKIKSDSQKNIKQETKALKASQDQGNNQGDGFVSAIKSPYLLDLRPQAKIDKKPDIGLEKYKKD